jgi:hypothetical protein
MWITRSRALLVVAGIIAGANGAVAANRPATQALHFVMLDDSVFLLAAMDQFLDGRRSR